MSDPRGPQRGQEGVTIRVGLTAIGFPLAAPTGVVDRSLRTEGDRLRVGNVTNRFAWVLRGEGCSAPNQARTLAANPAVDL